MYHGNERLKWAFRCGLNNMNRFLLHFVDVRKLKTINARLLQKKRIDLYHPAKLNEKILALSYGSDTTAWSALADKYEVRKYVEAKGLGRILVPLFAIYENVDEIDFATLPQKFVLKATHGCDMNYLCADKNGMDEAEVRRKARFWLQHNLAYMSLELHYARIKPRILCEKLLETEGKIVDYKFFCIGGQARFVEACTERQRGPFLNIYDLEWNEIADVVTGARTNPKGVKKPECLEMMREAAETLAGDFPFVRVDLYEADGRVYFGEMTFTPATGTLFHFRDWFLEEQGGLLISEMHV